jgi:hypothetical protein
LRKRWPATATAVGEVDLEGGERRHEAGEDEEKPETATRRGSLLSALMGGGIVRATRLGRNIKVADEPGLLAEWREVKLEHAAYQ